MSLSTTKTRDYPKVDLKRGVNYMKTISSSTYTTSNEDKGYVLILNSGSATTITLAALSVPIGSQIDFIRTGAGSVLFAADTGVTIRSKAGSLNLATLYTPATAIKLSATEWFLTGDLT
jgi:hypothetical protein